MAVEKIGERYKCNVCENGVAVTKVDGENWSVVKNLWKNWAKWYNQKKEDRMMKRTISVMIILIYLSLLSINIYAQDATVNADDSDYKIDVDKMDYQKTPINKLLRGILNTGTCVLEIPAGIYDISNKHGPALGYTLGLAGGTITAIARALTGMLEAITFIIPPYDESIMTPEYAFENFRDKMKSYSGTSLIDFTE